MAASLKIKVLNFKIFCHSELAAVGLRVVMLQCFSYM